MFGSVEILFESFGSLSGLPRESQGASEYVVLPSSLAHL